jgi:hypothetical protein
VQWRRSEGTPEEFPLVDLPIVIEIVEGPAFAPLDDCEGGERATDDGQKHGEDALHTRIRFWEGQAARSGLFHLAMPPELEIALRDETALGHKSLNSFRDPPPQSLAFLDRNSVSVRHTTDHHRYLAPMRADFSEDRLI